MKRLLAGSAVLATLAFAAPSIAALGPREIDRCLQFTTTTALRTAPILADLGLAREQVLEARARLSQYGTARYRGLNDLGFSPDQLVEIERRIAVQVAAMNRYPIGYPCKPFKHRTQTVAFVRTLLVDNGFRKASLRITSAYARQFQFMGIQDGYQYFGAVVRAAPRQIVIRLEAPRGSGATGGTYRFATPFDP